MRTKTVTHGRATVFASCVNNQWGWMLPGMIFTTSEARVNDVAIRMDRMIQRGKR